jgi:hypothetical protein
VTPAAPGVVPAAPAVVPAAKASEPVQVAMMQPAASKRAMLRDFNICFMAEFLIYLPQRLRDQDFLQETPGRT